MQRLPLLAGSRVVLARVGDETTLLTPPPPLDPIADTRAAVVDALRYPLAGASLEQQARHGGRATIVVEPHTLPLPGAPLDPRQEALAAVIDELERVGIPRSGQTILVAGGLERRAGKRELEELLRPEAARDFRGTVVVHDCEGDDLRPAGSWDGVPLHASRHLLDTDLVVTVTAAETVAHGGPAALLAAGSPEALRAGAASPSLLEPPTSAAWRLATALERAVGEHVPLIGVSLVLDHPRPAGGRRGYPESAAAREQAARSPARHLLGILPAFVRVGLLQTLPRDLNTAAVLGGTPSVAHAEALLRGIALRGTRFAAPFHTLVVPVPWKAAHQPREPLNPITATAVALGLAFRLWREAPPLVAGGTIVLLHEFRRAFGHGSQRPFHELFTALQRDPSPAGLAAAQLASATDERSIVSYRAGQAPHPLLPYADWAGCRTALDLAGNVIVAPCRDAAAARALAFVPSHSVQSALQMAQGIGGSAARTAVVLAPPYPPLVSA